MSLTSLPGLTLTLTPEWLWLRSERPLGLLSSGPGGDGVTAGRHVVSLHVDRSYCSDTPERDLAALVTRLGIAPGDGWVGLMTGVALDRASIVVRERDGLAVAAIVTVGLGNVSAAGRATPGVAQDTVPRPGTINAIVAIGAELTPAAMVNAAMTATEAKVLALMERGVRTLDGELASGTSSDAIVIAAAPPGEGGWRAAPLRYAGTATTLGLLIGAAVRAAISARIP